MIRKRFSIILLVLFLLTTCIGCGDQDITSQQSTTTGNQNQEEQGTNEIQIDAYDSDQMKKLGYKLELQGTRFPIPTTLNELGTDWSYNLGDTSDREAGAYDGQRYWRVGNVYTTEW